MCDLEETKAREKGRKEKMDLDERTQAEDMRRAAMEGLVKSSTLGKCGQDTVMSCILVTANCTCLLS